MAALDIYNVAGTDAVTVGVKGDSRVQGGTDQGQSPGPWGVANAPGGFFDLLTAALSGKPGPYQVTRGGVVAPGNFRVISSGPPAIVTPSILKPASFDYRGIGGSSVVSVTQWNGTAGGRPDLINELVWAEYWTGPKTLHVAEWAINDYILRNVQGLLTIADHLTAYNTMLDRIHRDDPTGKILCVGPLFINEAWSSAGGNHYTGSPAFPGSNPFDTNNWVDLNIAAATAARPYCLHLTIVDKALAFTVANEPEPGPNPPAGQPGLLSMNGLHGTLLEQQLEGTWWMSALNIITL